MGNRDRLRFNGLMEELGGISPKTLSDTLKELQAEGLLKRESFAEIPPRVEYSLTQGGVKLRKAIVPLLKWAATRSARDKVKYASAYRQDYVALSKQPNLWEKELQETKRLLVFIKSVFHFLLKKHPSLKTNFDTYIQQKIGNNMLTNSP